MEDVLDVREEPCAPWQRVERILALRLVQETGPFSQDVCNLHTMSRRSERPRVAPVRGATPIPRDYASPLPPVARRFFDVTRKLDRNVTARSENDLSRHLVEVLEEGTIGLHTSFDSTAKGSRKRPDILAYRERLDADLVLQADVVLESKLPSELDPGTNVVDALVDQFWDTKTYPYIAHNISRIQYFVLTTFTDFAFVRITDDIRRSFIAAKAQGGSHGALQAMVRAQAEQITLDDSERSIRRWYGWLQTHLRASQLETIPLSTIANTSRIETEADFEHFAERLASIAAGADGRHGGLFASLQERVAGTSELTQEMERDLRLFVMCQRPSMDLEAASDLIKKDQAQWIDEFIAASIHSLISRLFALKVIEDGFCIGNKRPLIEKPLWVLNTSEYNELSPDDLLKEVSTRMRALTKSKNTIIKRMAVFGSFFDWIVKQIDPIVFRTLFELFVVTNFQSINGDLLGRFFEVYAQRINRTKRKALGQYYTPLPVVRFMWWLAAGELRARNYFDEVTVLDPSMGSGTFLAAGARTLADAGISKFWERFVGFDISPQVLGIAQVNLYLSILPRVSELNAQSVTDLGVYTTDTLDPRNGRHLKQIISLITDPTHREFLSRSIELSSSIKQKDHFWLVIGNPPYKNNSTITLTQIAERFPNLLGSSALASKAQKRNIRDDYAWFFAAADEYVQGRGMICYVTSDSFLSHQSYSLFRRELVRNYHVRKIIRLGAGLFRDVGPNISFVITLLVRREAPLSDVELDAGPVEPSVELHDLRSLADGSTSQGDEDDPRLRFVDAVALGNADLGEATLIKPSAKHDFAMVDTDVPIVTRVKKSGVAITATFAHKWPGIITAFDSLLKDNDAQALEQRLRGLFAVCQRERASRTRLASAVERFAAEHGIEEIDRLQSVAQNAAEMRATFEPSRIKKSVSGSIPNDLRWYPPPKYRHFIYYDPSIKIERNVNAGKTKGWGSMGQWRDPASHLISPKLIFTSSSNPKYGFKAFVLDDEWYAKLHGGKSQQYNYTGIAVPPHLPGVENNLTVIGQKIRNALVGAGCLPTDLLHYVAGIYNSSLAEMYLEAEVSGDLLLRVPTTKPEIQLAVSICEGARKLRDLHHLLYDGPKEGQVERPILEGFVPSESLDGLGLSWRREAATGFMATKVTELPADWGARLRRTIAEEQATLDGNVESLYS